MCIEYASTERKHKMTLMHVDLSRIAHQFLSPPLLLLLTSSFVSDCKISFLDAILSCLLLHIIATRRSGASTLVHLVVRI